MKEKRNQIIALLYQNMEKFDADDTLNLIDELIFDVKNTTHPFVPLIHKKARELSEDEFIKWWIDENKEKDKLSKESIKEWNFVEELKKYFEKTPKEKVLEDWDKSKEWDDVSITVDEFIQNTNIQMKENVVEQDEKNDVSKISFVERFQNHRLFKKK